MNTRTEQQKDHDYFDSLVDKRIKIEDSATVHGQVPKFIADTDTRSLTGQYLYTGSGLFNQDLLSTHQPERFQDANLTINFEKSGSTENLGAIYHSVIFEKIFKSTLEYIEQELNEEIQEEKSLYLIIYLGTQYESDLVKSISHAVEKQTMEIDILSDVLIKLGVANSKLKSDRINWLLHRYVVSKNPRIRYSSLVALSYTLPLINLNILEVAYNNETIEVLKEDILKIINKIK